MKINIFLAPLTVLLGLSLIAFVYTSRQVGVLHAQLQEIRSEMHITEIASDTLDTEWAYLTNPERIEKLSTVLLPQEQIITAEYMRNLDSIRTADNVETVSIDNRTSLNIFIVQ